MIDIEKGLKHIERVQQKTGWPWKVVLIAVFFFFFGGFAAGYGLCHWHNEQTIASKDSEAGDAHRKAGELEDRVESLQRQLQTMPPDTCKRLLLQTENKLLQHEPRNLANVQIYSLAETLHQIRQYDNSWQVYGSVDPRVAKLKLDEVVDRETHLVIKYDTTCNDSLRYAESFRMAFHNGGWKVEIKPQNGPGEDPPPSGVALKTILANIIPLSQQYLLKALNDLRIPYDVRPYDNTEPDPLTTVLLITTPVPQP